MITSCFVFCCVPSLQLNAENDRAISEHVLRGHRYRKAGADMEPEPLNGTRGEGAGQENETESPEDAAQVGMWGWDPCLRHACKIGSVSFQPFKQTALTTHDDACLLLKPFALPLQVWEKHHPLLRASKDTREELVCQKVWGAETSCGSLHICKYIQLRYINLGCHQKK